MFIYVCANYEEQAGVELAENLAKHPSLAQLPLQIVHTNEKDTIVDVSAVTNDNNLPQTALFIIVCNIQQLELEVCFNLMSNLKDKPNHKNYAIVLSSDEVERQKKTRLIHNYLFKSFLGQCIFSDGSVDPIVEVLTEAQQIVHQPTAKESVLVCSVANEKGIALSVKKVLEDHFQKTNYSPSVDYVQLTSGMLQGSPHKIPQFETYNLIFLCWNGVNRNVLENYMAFVLEVLSQWYIFGKWKYLVLAIGGRALETENDITTQPHINELEVEKLTCLHDRSDFRWDWMRRLLIFPFMKQFNQKQILYIQDFYEGASRNTLSRLSYFTIAEKCFRMIQIQNTFQITYRVNSQSNIQAKLEIVAVGQGVPCEYLSLHVIPSSIKVPKQEATSFQHEVAQIEFSNPVISIRYVDSFLLLWPQHKTVTLEFGENDDFPRIQATLGLMFYHTKMGCRTIHIKFFKEKGPQDDLATRIQLMQL